MATSRKAQSNETLTDKTHHQQKYTHAIHKYSDRFKKIQRLLKNKNKDLLPSTFLY